MHFSSWKIENAKIVKPISRKIQKILRPQNFANTFRESYVIGLAYANARSRPSWHFWHPMSPCRDRKWLQHTIKRSDSKESIAESESTHLEVSGTTLTFWFRWFVDDAKCRKPAFYSKSRWPPRFPPKGQLEAEARGECFAPCSQTHKSSTNHNYESCHWTCSWPGLCAQYNNLKPSS